MKLRQYSAIIFDLDGTLIDSFTALATAVNHARESAGLPGLEPEEIRKFVGHGVEPLLEQSFGTIPGAEVTRIFNAKYDEICCGHSRLLDEVDATLSALATHDYAMAVCTNKPTRFSQKIIDHLGIALHFAVVAGPDLAGARKPDPAHVHWVLDALGCSPSDALFVGDMVVDIDAARGAGVDVAVLTAESRDVDSLIRAEPDYILSRFGELLQILSPAGALR